jgi:hypothetical protein
MFWNYIFRKSRRIKIKKNDRERILYYLKDCLINIDEENISKFECAKRFVKDLCGVDDLENLSISLGRMSSQTLVFLFVCFLMEYEDTNQYSKKYLKYNKLFYEANDILKKVVEKLEKLKKIPKDTFCVEVKVVDIFPFEELTETEARFIENFLDKIDVDLEFDENVLLSTRELIRLITQVMRISKESL